MDDAPLSARVPSARLRGISVLCLSGLVLGMASPWSVCGVVVTERSWLVLSRRGDGSPAVLVVTGWGGTRRGGASPGGSGRVLCGVQLCGEYLECGCWDAAESADAHGRHVPGFEE